MNNQEIVKLGEELSAFICQHCNCSMVGELKAEDVIALFTSLNKDGLSFEFSGFHEYSNGVFLRSIIIKEKEQTKIYIRDNQKSYSILYDLLHELGHFYLDHLERNLLMDYDRNCITSFPNNLIPSGVTKIFKSPSYIEKEEQANLFAMSVLVPLQQLKEVYAIHPRICRVAKHFKVCDYIIQAKLRELGIFVFR